MALQDKKPTNKYELALWQMLKEGGWELLKNGWPDIIAVKDDRVVVFEVKSKRSERLKETQLRCMDFLSRAGVECYRWDRDDGFLPYSETLPDVKALNSLRERRKKRRERYTCPICGEHTKSPRSLVCYICEHNPLLQQRINTLQRESDKKKEVVDGKRIKRAKMQGLQGLDTQC